jgi:hypothetical protein
VAEFEKSPGVRIPLLSDEECKERGIEPQRLPPFETWTPEQQEAGRELREILTCMAVAQAFRSVLRPLELMQAEGYSKDDFEKEATRRALAELRAGRWKVGREDVGGLEQAMGWVLESILNGTDGTGERKAHPHRRPKRTS